MREYDEREPICGFCWANTGERRPLVFDPLIGGCWVCPACGAQAISQSEAEQEMRRDLGRHPYLLLDNPYYYRDPNVVPSTVGLSVSEDVIDSVLRSRPGRSRPAGRRRKKDQRRVRPRGPTLAMDLEMVRRRKERREDKE